MQFRVKKTSDHDYLDQTKHVLQVDTLEDFMTWIAAQEYEVIVHAERMVLELYDDCRE